MYVIPDSQDIGDEKFWSNKKKRSKVCQMTYLLWVFIFISIGYNMIVKQVFSTSRLQSHKFILANIEQTVKMENKKRKENKRIQVECENNGNFIFSQKMLK